MNDKRYLKRCTLCGAEVYSDSRSRHCYKCDSKMILINNGRKYESTNKKI